MLFEIVSVCKGGGYKYARTNPIHPKANAKGLYPLHRVLMENKLGRLLDSSEDVHHRDEDKTNDDPDNLEIKGHGEHAKEHALERAPEWISLRCVVCCKVFSVLPSKYRDRVKQSQGIGLSCSRSCGARLGNLTKFSAG